MTDQEMFQFDESESENYHGTIDVSIPKLPTIRLISIEFRPSACWLQRLAIATLKRHFTLAEDWKVAFNRIKAPDQLNGVVTIPRKYENEVLDYDGASVPVPWLISFLSIGALRPLGVMLIPSIVHDFAFRFGVLLVAETPEATPRAIKIERHEADALFYNMIRTLNGDFLTATLAWLAVRLGWPFVRFNGKRAGGKAPFGPYALAFFVVAVAIVGVGLLAKSVGWSGAISWFAIGVAGIYLLIWFATLLVLRWSGNSDRHLMNKA